MSLDFLFGRGFLTLRRHALNGWAHVQHLRLEIPDLRFPIDMRAGAERFAQHRNQIVSLRACISESELALLGERLTPGLRGVQHLTWRWRDGEIEVQLETTAEAGGGRVVARYGVLPPNPKAPSTLRLLPFSLLSAGAFPRPPSLLLTQALIELLNPGAHPHLLAHCQATHHGDEIHIPALEWLCAELFARYGWKLPAREGASLEAVEVRSGQLTLDIAGAPSPKNRRELEGSSAIDNCLEGDRATRALAAAHQRSLLRDAERAFFAEDLERALTLLREAEGTFGRSDLAFARQVEILLHESRAHGLEEILLRAEQRLERDHQDVPALAALIQVARARERMDDERSARERLLAALEAGGRHAERTMLLLDAIEREVKFDATRALELCKEAMRLSPRHPSVLRLTARLARRAGDFDLLEETLGRSLRVPRQHSERVEHGLELADLLSQRHQDHSRALDLLKGLPADEKHRPTVLALTARIAERAQRPHDALRQWTSLAEYYEGIGDNEGQAKSRAECARLWMDTLGDPSSALAALLQAARLAPDHASFHAAIVRASLATGDFRPGLLHGERGLGLLEAREARSEAERAELEDARAELLEAMGELHTRRGHLDEAARMWRELLQLRPDHARAWEALESHLRASGDPEALLGFYAAELERSDDPAQSARLLRASARVLDEGLGLGSQAIEHLRRALHLQPDDTTLLHALDALLDRRGEPGRLLGILDDIRHLASSREALTQLALLRARAAIRAERPRLAREAAIEGLKRMPSHLELLRIARDHSHRDEDAEPFLLALADISPEAAERRDAASRLAELAEARGDHVDASRWRALDLGAQHTRIAPVSEKPVDPVVRARFEASTAPRFDSNAAQAEARVVEVIAEEPNAPSRPQAHAIQQEPLVSSSQPSADDETVDEVSNATGEARQEELARRADRYRAQGEHGALCDLLPELVALTEAPQARAALLNELGQVLHHDLEETARARPYLEEARRLDPDGVGRDFALVSTLEGIYEDLDEPDGLFEMYAHRLAESSDEQMRNVYRILMATTLWERLGRPEESLRLLREVLEQDAQHLAALRLQAEVMESTGNLMEAAQSLRAIVALPDGDPFEVQEVLRLLGRLEWRSLGQLDAAASRFLRLLDEIPGDTESLSALKQIFVEAGQPERATEIVLRELGILLGSLEGLPSIEALLALEPKAVPAALHATFASIVLELLPLVQSDTNAFRGLLRFAQRMSPDDPGVLEAKVSMLRTQGQSRELAEALEELAAELLEGPERAALLEEAAQLWEKEGDALRAAEVRPQGSSRPREDAIGTDRASTEGEGRIERLDRLVASGRTEEALSELDSLLPDTRTPDARRELLVRKGRWVLDLRPQAGEALLLLKGALIFDESAADTRLELARAQALQGDLRGALDQLRSWAERCTDADLVAWDADNGAEKRWRSLAKELSPILSDGLHAWLEAHQPRVAARLASVLDEPLDSEPS